MYTGLRLYILAGQAAVRMGHTMVYDGNEEEDFIRGVGMSFRVPLTGDVHSRFVRLGGEEGLFCESPMLLQQAPPRAARTSGRRC